MADDNWPVGVSALLNAAGWKWEPEDNNIRTTVDAGPQKSRPRFTKARKNMKASVEVDWDGKAILENFYYDTLVQGNKPFNFPLFGVSYVWKFRAPISFEPVGDSGVLFNASLDLALVY